MLTTLLKVALKLRSVPEIPGLLIAPAIRRGCISVSLPRKLTEWLDVTARYQAGSYLWPMQSHGGQVRHLADIPRWCDDVTDSANPTRFARRSLLKAAVLGQRDESGFSIVSSDIDAGVAEGS